jgi:hypothetical protein
VAGTKYLFVVQVILWCGKLEITLKRIHEATERQADIIRGIINFLGLFFIVIGDIKRRLATYTAISTENISKDKDNRRMAVLMGALHL